MSISWISPKIGDVVLLSQGFESAGQTKGPHYGLVIGIFKIHEKGHDKFVMIAPGTSIKPGYILDKKSELLIPSSLGIIGKDTKFYFTVDNIVIYKFPSEDFVKSNRPQSQPDQHSATVGNLADLTKMLGEIKKDNGGDILNLYSKVFAEWEIDIADIAEISATKPAEFLK
ncbi:hypothetical protein [Paracidovorax valerianellae]|uniref:hypothetical protein n=1 Tax=Paracidovorax valerianellae TaxID=187868 RepID=UPI001113F40C|nr:hypothetical protein [Paracidovorax valerianellae]MDA8447874.1 hypothetical protein [Paracidovorax valerianellae]